MIRSFSCKESKKIFEGHYSRKLPTNIQERALRKLRQLDAAINLEDLKVPPSNHLEILSGDLSNTMSIRINNQWRLCFIWEDGEAYAVKIIDYH
jgi:proteic killer suppression protein